MLSLIQILLMIIQIVWYVVIAHVVMSWLINFQVLNLRQQLVAQIWYGLERLLGPIYAKIRSFLPPMGGLDLAPLVLLLGLMAIRIVLINNASSFY
ncbi:YggT family protein [Aliiroseovarius lamellibrachiae]|uniref:YggT family protein n=1 Tax=Aliiroseovarius lamellibrachiae TaxID=1924933 RepID=UPI001BE0F91B|nr:YggT family protein [Aliiroseovarius lamellibrachiae]MBT2131487.1 YggT family protein [Aliiroseovarius lamellibrachiae]